MDEVLRRAVLLVYRKMVAEFMWNELLNMDVEFERLIDSVIEEIVFNAVEKFGHLVSSIDILLGTIFELIILKSIHENLDYVYKGVQVGFSLKRGNMDLKDVYGMLDIVLGYEGKIHTIIEAKKQFRVDETEKFKLIYFIKVLM